VSRKRALVAAALATIYPGLGHVYLRSWFRALTWFGLSLLTAAVVVPPAVIQSYVSAYDAGGLSAMAQVSQALPLEAFLAILAVRVLNVVDAAWIGLGPRNAARSTDGRTCPNCGREIDDDLDFCHWCTTQLDGTREESRADSGFL